MMSSVLYILVLFLALLLGGCTSTTPSPIPPTSPPQSFAAGAIASPSLITSDGVTLATTYYSPTSSPAPGILLLHMLNRNRGDWQDFALQLQQAGYAVLAIDLRGHGDSNGARDFSLMENDVAAAILFLRSPSQAVDKDRLALIGASIGANIALRYAANHPDIPGVILLSPGANYHDVTTLDAMATYGSRPILIAASSEDSYAADSARQLDAIAQGPHQLLLYDQQGHGTNMLGKNNGLETAILDWLQQLFATP